MAGTNSAKAKKHVAPVADAREILDLVKQIRATRAQLAAPRHTSLRALWFWQKLQRLEEDACAPNADPVALMRLLEAYAVGATLWPIANARIKAKTRRQEIVADSNTTIGEGVGRRLDRLVTLWDDHKKRDPDALVDLRSEHVRAQLNAEGFRRGTSRETFDRDVRKLKKAGRIS